MFNTLIYLSIFVSASMTSTATQTDWSGGSGVQGPVSSWNNAFWSSGDNVLCNYGKIQLRGPIIPVKHTIKETFSGAISVYSDDVDGDGDADILGASLTASGILWWENTDGTGTVWVEHNIDELVFQPRSIHSTDVDGDGDTDILCAAEGPTGISWWENTDGTGTSWAEHTVDGGFTGATCVYSADVDGDGDADVLGTDMYADDITWWENNDGTGTIWTEHTVDGDFDRAISVLASDVDGDGDEDIVGAALEAHDITWWENTNGTGTSWAEHTVDGDYTAPRSVYSTDIDGDGDADILGASLSEDNITWWENTDGSGTGWTEHIVDGNFTKACYIFSDDLDSDGDADVLGGALGASGISWWENTDGTGTSWVEHAVDNNFNGASSVYSTDVDGDGDADVLGSAFFDNEIAWWNLMNAPVGTLESSILDAGYVGTWNIFLSSSQEPSGTSVSFQFRSSSDFSNMGAWSDTVFSPDTPLAGILDDSTRYLQYKVILETSTPGISPELTEVAFSYTPQVGVEDSGSSEIPSWSFHVFSNPSYGFLSASVLVPEAGSVNLSLYDVSGRMISEVSQELPAGIHSVTFTGLAEGVYFCVLNAEDFSSSERIVVLN